MTLSVMVCSRSGSGASISSISLWYPLAGSAVHRIAPESAGRREDRRMPKEFRPLLWRSLSPRPSDRYQLRRNSLEGFPGSEARQVRRRSLPSSAWMKLLTGLAGADGDDPDRVMVRRGEEEEEEDSSEMAAEMEAARKKAEETKPDLVVIVEKTL